MSTEFHKASLFHRVAAKLIDVLLAFGILFLVSPLSSWLGFALGLCYLGFNDSIGDSQSLGKKIIGLQVRETTLLTPCSVGLSWIRNFPFVIFFFCTVLSWFFFPIGILGIAIVGIEIYLLVMLGHRWGDTMSHTTVFESPIE